MPVTLFQVLCFNIRRKIHKLLKYIIVDATTKGKFNMTNKKQLNITNKEPGKQKITNTNHPSHLKKNKRQIRWKIDKKRQIHWKFLKELFFPLSYSSRH